MRSHYILLGAVLALALTVPMTTLGAGDDCPPPGTDTYEDPGYVDNEDPVGGDGDGDGGGSGASDPSTEETTESGGLFGSLSGMSTGQLTIGILAVVGVIVGAVYFFMLARMDDDILE